MITRSPLEKGMSSYVKDTVEVHPKVTVIQGTVDKFENGIVHINDQKIPAPGIGVFIGGEPDTQWLPESIVVNKETGRIKTNSRFATNMPGVYAVGDVREGSMARLAAAAGEGALVETYLAEDFRLMKNVEREQRGLPIPESENF
jgi:thioredoxin reductase (NADPH)